MSIVMVRAFDIFGGKVCWDHLISFSTAADVMSEGILFYVWFVVVLLSWWEWH